MCIDRVRLYVFLAFSFLLLVPLWMLGLGSGGWTINMPLYMEISTGIRFICIIVCLISHPKGRQGVVGACLERIREWFRLNTKIHYWMGGLFWREVDGLSTPFL